LRFACGAGSVYYREDTRERMGKNYCTMLI
jgi:hypothetical protein